MLWSVRSFRFFTLSFFLRNGKNCHGALVSFTLVKSTNVDNLFYSFVTNWKKWFLALVGLTLVKGTSVRKKGLNKEGTVPVFLEPFLIEND